MTRPPDPVLPTIAEDAATGEIAALYADMRAVLRLPVVNLIYRHLATLPGALAWCWGTLRPLYASGAVDATAGRLLAGVALPAAPPHSPALLEAVGVPAGDLAQVRRVLETYHRANPLNLLALAVLLARMAGAESPRPAGPPAAPAEAGQRLALAADASAPLPPLPPMIDPVDMAPATAALARELAALGVSTGAGEMPSVWRNLAHWPGYLALSVAVLAPLEADGWLAAQMDALRTGRDALAVELAAHEAHAAATGARAAELPSAVRAPVQAVLRRFTDGLIVRIIPLIAVLRQRLPPEQ